MNVPFQHANWLRIAAGILINAQDEVLIDLRVDGQFAGKWEFPGGKVEAGESLEQALARELAEEVGVSVSPDAMQPLIQLHYAYPDYALELNFFTITDYSGQPFGKEQQSIRWVARDALHTVDFLPSNQPVLRALQLPPTCLITPEPAAPAPFLQQLEAALQRGIRCLILRAKTLDAAAYQSLAAQVIERAQNYGAKVLLNSPATLLPAAAGLHLTSQQLMALQTRPALASRQLLSASCHNARELSQAEKLGADFALLSPVQPTPSHPDAPALGWQAFRQHISGVNLPVYALGGMQQADLPIARKHGAQGIAAISALWGAAAK